MTSRLKAPDIGLWKDTSAPVVEIKSLTGEAGAEGPLQCEPRSALGDLHLGLQPWVRNLSRCSASDTLALPGRGIQNAICQDLRRPRRDSCVL